jgi:hypothetical protein
MKKYLIVTIDTECDNQWDDFLARNIRLENLKEIPKLQALFGKFGIRPCYLITYPVARDRYSLSMFKEFVDASVCEVGAHLHTWTTPPVSDSEIKYRKFLHSLPRNLQREKFDNLHNAIMENLKIEPKSYRGGKYSFDEHLLEMLEERRYLVDTSVTPFNNWSHIGGPDFTSCITVPYFPSRTNVFIRGDSPVLEVPVSIDFNRVMPLRLKKLILRFPSAFHMQGILRRLGLCKLIWLDPSFQTFSEMKVLTDLILKKGENPCINLMFHSSVLMAGGSPYNRTKEDVASFYERLEAILFYLVNDKGVINLMPKDFAALYKR